MADDKPLPLSEQKIKAGVVYNLLKYTEWPKIHSPQASDNKHSNNQRALTLQVCLLGGDPFNGYLFPLQGRTAQQATIEIIHIEQVLQTESCRAVIIHHNQEQQLQSLLRFLQGKNILTISDIAQFAEQGGMVELARHNEKVNLRINQESLNNARLAIDERMLKLAQIIPTSEVRK